MMLTFSEWLKENMGTNGGMPPPMQQPSWTAVPDYNLPGSEELPPTKKINRRRRRKNEKLAGPANTDILFAGIQHS